MWQILDFVLYLMVEGQYNYKAVYQLLLCHNFSCYSIIFVISFFNYISSVMEVKSINLVILADVVFVSTMLGKYL